MGQNSDSGLNHSPWSISKRHVCFLTILQPADNSPHNAAKQTGLRHFGGIADPHTRGILCSKGWGKGEENSIRYLSFKTQAASSIKGNDS